MIICNVQVNVGDVISYHVKQPNGIFSIREKVQVKEIKDDRIIVDEVNNWIRGYHQKVSEIVSVEVVEKVSKQ